MYMCVRKVYMSAFLLNALIRVFSCWPGTQEPRVGAKKTWSRFKTVTNEKEDCANNNVGAHFHLPFPTTSLSTLTTSFLHPFHLHLQASHYFHSHRPPASPPDASSSTSDFLLTSSPSSSPLPPPNSLASIVPIVLLLYDNP